MSGYPEDRGSCMHIEMSQSSDLNTGIKMGRSLVQALAQNSCPLARHNLPLHTQEYKRGNWTLVG